MDKIRNLFRALDKQWLIRHYAFSFAFFIFFLFTSQQAGRGFNGAVLIFLPCALLYPFAMFVYESIVNLIMGENVFILNFWLLMVWKLVRFLVIWVFAIPIGVIGFLYLLWHVNRGQE